MCDVKGQTINQAIPEGEYINEIKQTNIEGLSKDVNLDKPSKEDLRLLRLAFYNKKNIV
jgi:hypothetical protein